MQQMTLYKYLPTSLSKGMLSMEGNTKMATFNAKTG